MQSLSTGQMIKGYFLTATKAVSTLFREELYGHTLVIIFSTIDTCGLLDAPPTQSEATGESFKAWVKKYLLGRPGIQFNENDLWGARCAVLHTFTSESSLSKGRRARELQYYTGDKTTPHIQRFVAFTTTYEGGRHLPVHYGDLCEAFFQAIKQFVPDLDANCTSSTAYNDRLRKIMQVYHVEPTT